MTDRFDRALLYAIHVHGGQVRKGTSIPYIAHLLAVSATVLEYGGDEDLAIAALLHDSVEDQGGKARLEDVRNRFGDRVANVVAACSDSMVDTGKGEQKPDWRTRKEAYIAHLGTAGRKSGSDSRVWYHSPSHCPPDSTILLGSAEQISLRCLHNRAASRRPVASNPITASVPAARASQDEVDRIRISKSPN
jgi:hypothetical protein